MMKNELLKEIMRYDFTADELNLFLDTHPTDVKALQMHKAITEKLKELMMKYEEEYGCLEADNCRNTERWTWNDSPWPWENMQGGK